MDLLTVKEVAEMTRLPAGTLRYFRHCGTGPESFKIGRRLVYRRQAVLDWLTAQEAADHRRRSA